MITYFILAVILKIVHICRTLTTHVELFFITLLESDICSILTVLFTAKLDFFVVFKLLFHERIGKLGEMGLLELAPSTRPPACLIT
jgi:hypothetical protein